MRCPSVSAPDLCSGGPSADGEGLFIGTVTIPVTTSLGRHVVTAICSRDDGKELAQELPLTVSAAEEPTPLDPTLAVGGSASPGGVAHVKGAGCQRDSEVRVVLGAANPVTTTAGPEGQFFAELTVPADAQLGQLKVSAICTGNDGTELTQATSLEIVPAEPQPTETKPARVIRDSSAASRRGSRSSPAGSRPLRPRDGAPR